MRYFVILAVAVILVAGLAGPAMALQITDPGVVGTIRPPEPSSPADEVVYVNTLLAQPANNGGVTIGDYTYTTSPTDYNGLVSAADTLKDATGNNVVPAGWEFVLAKYDGPQGGDVLFAIGGASIILPLSSEPLWVNPGQEGYGLSHFSVFNNTPIPLPAAAWSGLTLMGILGIGGIVRKIKGALAA